MKKKLLAVGIVFLSLVLGGCLSPTQPSPELRVTFGASRTTVVFEVIGPRAAKYVWDFGDGNSEETTLPKVVHRYSHPGEYFVVVKAYGAGNTGEGLPGPGISNPNVLAFQLETIVDTRPAIEIIGIKITPVDPPRWYAPGTPAWPEWHYPACTILRMELLSKVNRPGEVKIVNVHWVITDAYGRFGASQGGKEWVWYEAQNFFIAYGCPSGRTEYRVYVYIAFSDGSEYEIRQSIFACPPGGCA
jgi:hypothetical protein